MERFIRYPRSSFYVRFASRVAQGGVIVDAPAANAAVACRLREVATARVRLEIERAALQPIAAPYGGQITRTPAPEPSSTMRPIQGLQHPLSAYEALVPAGAVL